MVELFLVGLLVAQIINVIYQGVGFFAGWTWDYRYGEPTRHGTRLIQGGLVLCIYCTVVFGGLF